MSFCFSSKEVTSLSVSISGMTLLSGSDDCTARVWHIGSRQCIKKMNFKGLFLLIFDNWDSTRVLHVDHTELCL